MCPRFVTSRSQEVRFYLDSLRIQSVWKPSKVKYNNIIKGNPCKEETKAPLKKPSQLPTCPWPSAEDGREARGQG